MFHSELTCPLPQLCSFTFVRTPFGGHSVDASWLFLSIDGLDSVFHGALYLGAGPRICVSEYCMLYSDTSAKLLLQDRFRFLFFFVLLSLLLATSPLAGAGLV